MIDVMDRFVATDATRQWTDLLVDGQKLLLPILIVVGVFTIILLLIVRWTRKGSIPDGSYALITAFAFLGGIAGLIAGNSRDPIAGPLLTGLLGVITALLSYLFSNEALKTYRAYIPFLIIALVLNALGGLTIGAGYRKQFETYDQDRKAYMLLYEKVQLELWKEEEKLKLHKQYADVVGQLKKPEK